MLRNCQRNPHPLRFFREPWFMATLPASGKAVLSQAVKSAVYLQIFPLEGHSSAEPCAYLRFYRMTPCSEGNHRLEGEKAHNPRTIMLTTLILCCFKTLQDLEGQKVGRTLPRPLLGASRKVFSFFFFTRTPNILY